MANKACGFLYRQFVPTLCKALKGSVNCSKTDAASCAVRGKYPVGSFTINRHIHTSQTADSRRFSAVAELKTPESSKTATELVIETLVSTDLGRLFAVVQVAGKQRKVTTEDVIIVQSDFPPNVGDRIRLEKVLLVGGKDFTLMGTPMLSRQQVCVEATVIEKTISQYQINFGYKRRHRSSHFRLNRNQQTVLLINSIDVNRNMDL
ncbi:39S ribosomal protein L21, mitochondrial-like isoform X1 [Mizuhopecten yessoensis]|uniref:39S ribosomal protein L21, mitochondrial-like isoform X1 n=1 Tax=Mizuhopecten yessoensis TaxID=6573 RepID=UPI000B45DD2D|nr:39S ribosomal protein L21, mitochondrial-like isoform X1 [Mizuhopecten yessoensis]